MNVRHLVAAVLGCAISILSIHAVAETRAVHFAKGASSASLKGSIEGRAFDDYKLRATVGQRMNVSMNASHPSAYFNVLPPGSSDVAIHVGSTNGNQWAGTLTQSGEYTVRVYLMRNEARRGTRATYTLEVGIAGTQTPNDALVTGTPFHATGQLPCRMGNEAATSCPFGVIRTGKPGHAEVRIAPPGGLERILRFAGTQVTTPGGGSVKSSRNGDEWSVEVNDFEHYRIVDAVIDGG